MLLSEIKPLTILNELTVSDINQNTVKFPKKSRCRDLKTHVINVSNVKFTPFEPSKELWIESNTKSSGGVLTYRSELIFKDVIYGEEGEGVSFRGSDNNDHTIVQLSARHNDIECDCQCADFIYRAKSANYKKGSGIFPPDPYIKKSNRKPVNPEQIPIFCKHLLGMINKLVQLRMLKFD